MSQKLVLGTTLLLLSFFIYDLFQDETLEKARGTASAKALHSNKAQEVQPTVSTEMSVTFPSTTGDEAPTVLNFSLTGEDRKISFSELLEFLNRNWGNDREYILNVYDCKHFAFHLYEDAVRQDIAVRFVTANIKNRSIGHAFNAFNTADRGIVFVDFTPGKGAEQFSRALKNIVYAHPGDPLIRIPLNKVSSSFDNQRDSFFSKLNSGKVLREKLSGFSLKHDDFALRHKEMEVQRRALEQNSRSPEHSLALENFNAMVKNLNEEARQYNLEVESVKRAADEETWILSQEDWIIESMRLYPSSF